MELLLHPTTPKWSLLLLLYVAIAWLSSHFILTAIKRSKLNPKRVPPGPFPLPLVGNIFTLGNEPHKSLGSLARKYGPLMSLHLGSQTTVVISSPSVAKEVLQTQDARFANRNVPDSLTSHHEFSVSLRPADARWRMYRRICTSHVFANSRLDATQPLRRRKVQELLAHVQTSCDSGETVNVGQAVFTTSLNFLSNTVFSIDLGDPNSAMARKFRQLATDMTVESGYPNIADFFPLLKPLDPQGYRKRTTAAVDKLVKFFDTIIVQRLEEEEKKRQSNKVRKSDDENGGGDVLDSLLSLTQQSNEFHMTDLHHLLLDLFVAGTDTTSSSIEWAMAELLRNPQKMRKAQNELEQVIGKGNTLEEEDATRLPYLQAIVKETLRMYPAVPFLLPRKVFEDTSLCGFIIPKNTQVIVNAYAIGRDASLWSDPDSFEPERFLGTSVDFKGHDFELIPFGSGRRICPGMPLAVKLFHWMLGSLIHSFDWRLEDGVTPETLNMDEKFGFTMHRVESLYAFPMPK